MVWRLRLHRAVTATPSCRASSTRDSARGMQTGRGFTAPSRATRSYTKLHQGTRPGGQAGPGPGRARARDFRSVFERLPLHDAVTRLQGPKHARLLCRASCYALPAGLKHIYFNSPSLPSRGDQAVKALFIIPSKNILLWKCFFSHKTCKEHSRLRLS